MDVLKYFLCIFQLLLFYIFTVLLNVNSSPSDISLNSSHQAAYCIIISTQNWSCGDSCRILKVIFSEKLDEVIVASSLCTAMFWETQQRRPFQLCHERKVWGEVNSFALKMSWWLHVVARNFKFPIFDLQMRETFTLYLHFNHEYHILYSLLYLLFDERIESENRRYHLAAGKSAHCIPLILSLHIPMLLLQFYLHEH